MTATPDLAALDAALLRLRRLWATPSMKGQLNARLEVDVEMSTVLVVEAVQRVSAEGEVSISDVAVRLSVEASTASRLVERAAVAGMVRRRPSSSDARRVSLELTADGEGLAQRAVAFRTEFLRSVLDGWSAADRHQLAALFTRFADAVEHAGAAGA